MLILHHAEFNGRANLGDFLNRRGLVGDAVEIGTHQGDFAATLLDGWHGRKLWCVDPWTAIPPEFPDDRTLDLAVMRARLSPYIQAGRCETLRTTSVEAAARFDDNGLDLVYIDGDHHSASVTQDIAAWWPKIRPGGILAGHDFICPWENGGGWGMEIQEPVMSHAAREGVTVKIIVELNGDPWSFLIEKPK